MSHRASILIAAVWLAALTFLLSCSPEPKASAPRLVVLIGLDQFRADYLQRYDPVLSRGFRRLKDQGLLYERAMVDHAPSLSYPGHTTLATGAYPKTHGLVSNDWPERTEDGGYTRVVATLDANHEIVGFPQSRGVSPSRIRVSGLADWIREADPNARTAAVSTGPYLAMLYGGKARRQSSENHVYWMSRTEGVFVTSTYYREEYPEWLSRFNSTEMPKHRRSLLWENSTPDLHRGLARRDDAPYEGDEVHISFPHGPGDMSTDLTPEIENRWYYDSPLANEALFALARAAVMELSLGRRDATDSLAIAVKSTDRIGHDYGPHSQEQLDNIYRLDRLLGEFLDFLDEAVGPDAYIVALSSDHGAPNATEFELEQGRHSRRVTEDEISRALSDVKALVEGHRGEREELPALIAAKLEGFDFISRAMTPDELMGTGESDDILHAYRNSYDPSKPNLYPLWTMEILRGSVDPTHPGLFGVVVEVEYQANLWTATTTHGSAHDYDRIVPIIFMGKGVTPGVSREEARTVDVAPTLARLAGVPFPGTVDGRVLSLD